jgi:multiple sugar transport system permease protein/sn-glycerol 3-phosphate transport system permease protein
MVGLWSFVDEAGPDTQLLMAGAVLSLLPVLVLYFMLQRHFTATLVTSGLKG